MLNSKISRNQSERWARTIAYKKMDKIEKTINKAVKKGYPNCRFTVKGNLVQDFIKKDLTELGYKVSCFYSGILIEW